MVLVVVVCWLSASVLAALALGRVMRRAAVADGGQLAVPSRAEPVVRLDGLLAALAGTDQATWRHSRKVAELAAGVGERLGLDRAGRAEVELGALLHDIGKLRLPAETVRKSGPLTDEDWELVRRHPDWGADAVAAIPGLAAVAQIVRCHHERPDGTGYPHGLRGHRIPLASRIVSVCDAYCAMTSDRPYRDALEPGEALQELHRHSGTQFDPRVVEALERTVRRDVLVAV